MGELGEDRIKHLQMVQDAIARMAEESGRLKRYALITIGVLASASVASKVATLALFGAAMAMVFGALDARYLQQERWFRAHFDLVRAGNGPTDFGMTPDDETRQAHSLASAMAGWSIIGFYGALLGMSLLLALVVTALPVAG